MSLQTNERIQPQDKFEVEEYKKPTDKRFKGFKVGKMIQFKDRLDILKGIVGGFTMLDVEQVWVRKRDVDWHIRHRADEVEFLREIKIKKTKEEKELEKKEKKKIEEEKKDKAKKEEAKKKELKEKKKAEDKKKKEKENAKTSK